MAALISKQDGQIKCGATIIDSYYALTAAHCVNSPGMYANNLELLVGEHDYRNRMPKFIINLLNFVSFKLIFRLLLASETPYTQKYEIAAAVRHPSYSSEKDINDIALITLSKPIAFNTGVGPVCLPFKYGHFFFV